MTRIIIIAFFLCNLSFAEEDHTFTDSQGRSITAKMLDYNPSSRKILIESVGRKAVWVNLDIFSSADQPYIQEWIKNSYFMSESSFEIRVKSKTSKRGKKNSSGTGFSFIINNRNSEALKNLRVEYCLFWDRSVDGTIDVGSQVYKLDIGDVAQNSRREVRTCIHQSIRRKGFRKEVVGLSLRVYMENYEGKTLVREVRYPENLSKEKYVWGDTEAEASLYAKKSPEAAEGKKEKSDKTDDYYRIKFIVETASWQTIIQPLPPWDKDWHVTKTTVVEPKSNQHRIYTKKLGMTEHNRGDAFKKVEFTVYFKALRARDLEFTIHQIGDSEEVTVRAFNICSGNPERIGTYTYSGGGYVTYKMSAKDINKYGTVKFTPPK